MYCYFIFLYIRFIVWFLQFRFYGHNFLSMLFLLFVTDFFSSYIFKYKPFEYREHPYKTFLLSFSFKSCFMHWSNVKVESSCFVEKFEFPIEKPFEFQVRTSTICPSFSFFFSLSLYFIISFLFYCSLSLSLLLSS